MLACKRIERAGRTDRQALVPSWATQVTDSRRRYQWLRKGLLFGKGMPACAGVLMAVISGRLGADFGQREVWAINWYAALDSV